MLRFHLQSLQNQDANFNYIYKNGEGLLFNLGYSTKGFAIDLSAKHMDNMLWRSTNVNVGPTDLLIGYLPALTKQHTYNLAATLYPYATNFYGEIAYQLDLLYKIPKKTKKTNSKYEIIGESKQIKSVKSLIEKIAPTNAKVLILGPNGSGKELVARQIHSNSLRSDGPFIEVNCAAIPSELIESELFGHIKGSFTSAHKDRIGKFEAANEGTIFLDEIGDMSLSAQSKVLRAIQENKIQKVGSDKDIYVDTRVIAATNKNITELIKSNKFREDLYHRISVIELNVPPLNDRKPDIPLLIDYFIQQLTDQYDGRHLFIDETGIKKMTSYDWKGNVRELRNIVERLFILSESDQITEKEVVKYSGKK